MDSDRQNSPMFERLIAIIIAIANKLTQSRVIKQARLSVGRWWISCLVEEHWQLWPEVLVFTPRGTNLLYLLTITTQTDSV